MNAPHSWQDIIIENIPRETVEACLAEWSNLVSGECYVVFASRFGDFFLRRRDGSTEHLDVLEGTLTKVSENEQGFTASLKLVDWHDDYLLAGLVFGLRERGHSPGPHQVYGFAPHPAIRGEIDLDQAMVMDLVAWHAICAQTVGGQR